MLEFYEPTADKTSKLLPVRRLLGGRGEEEFCQGLDLLEHILCRKKFINLKEGGVTNIRLQTD